MTEQFDDPFSWASAYIDGELTDDARVRAEADDAVMAEVDRLDGLRREVRAVPPPSDRARDSAISAAMSAFAERPVRDRTAGERRIVAAPDPTAAEESSRHGDRRVPDHRSRWFMAVAAVSLVVMGGAVVMTRGGDDTNEAEVATRADTTLAELRSELEDAGATSAGAAAPSELAREESASATAGDAASELAEPQDADDTGGTGDRAADAATAESAGGDLDAAAPESATAVDAAIQPDEAELTAYVDQLLDEVERGDIPPTPNTRCALGDGRVTAEVLAEDDLDTPSGTRSFLIGHDPATDTALAIDPDTCEIVLEVPLD